jgi:hypothetical protein
VNPSNETCDNLDNNCNGTVDEGNPGGGATCMNPLGCSGTSACQTGTLNCIVPNNPEICDGIDNNCNGLIDEGAGTVTNIFTDEFANNTKGWTLGLTWAIGPTVAGPLPPFGNSDPALDHTATANNGVAGVVLGGNYNATNVTPAYYITSPNINTSGTGFVTLDFWRWLNTDWPEYVAATIDVSANGGTTWTNIWIQPTGGTLEDTAWTQINHNLSAYKSTTMRIRFGYQVLQNEVAGAFVMSGWNVDDVLVRRCQ